MDLNQLLYFRTAARLGNITRAAELHYTSQSCVSKNIAKLEQEVGAELFIRMPGRIELTDAGRAFLNVVDESVSTLQQGMTDLAQRKMNRTTLSFSCTMNFRIDPILLQMAQQYPDHAFKVLERGYKHLSESFEHNEIDLAFISRPHYSENLVCQRIAWAHPYLVVHKNHSLAKKAEVSLSELEQEKFLVDLTLVDKEAFINSCAAMGFFPNIQFQAKNIVSAVGLLSENLCVSIMPAIGPLFYEQISSELRLIKIKENFPPVYIGVAYHKTKGAPIETPAYQDLIRLFSNQLLDEIQAGEERWKAHHEELTRNQ